MSEKKILVGGDWVTGRGGLIQSVNPANGELIAEFNGASIEDVDIAVAAGKAAMSKPEWRKLRPHERAMYLHRIATLIDDNQAALARLQMADTGKCLSETSALVNSAAGTFRYVAAALETLEDEMLPTRGDCLTMSVYEPIGVGAGPGCGECGYYQTGRMDFPGLSGSRGNLS